MILAMTADQQAEALGFIFGAVLACALIGPWFVKRLRSAAAKDSRRERGSE